MKSLYYLPNVEDRYNFLARVDPVQHHNEPELLLFGIHLQSPESIDKDHNLADRKADQSYVTESASQCL